MSGAFVDFSGITELGSGKKEKKAFSIKKRNQILGTGLPAESKEEIQSDGIWKIKGTLLSVPGSDQRVVVYNVRLKRPVTTLLCIRHASYWRTLHVRQRWGTVPRVHYHSRLTWHCFSKD